MGARSELDRQTARPSAASKREGGRVVAQRRPTAKPSQQPQSTDNAAPEYTQVRTRDLAQALDLLEGLQHILSSFHEDERGKIAPDPLLQELEGIHGHGYNWEALRYQAGVGEGWSYIGASIGELRARLLERYAEADDVAHSAATEEIDH